MTNGRRQQFLIVANQFVRKSFRKREVAKLGFETNEIDEIIRIKRFIEDVLADNRDELEKSLELGYKKYICVTVKVTIGEMFTFVNQFIDIEDLNYSKDSLYVPKAIYTLSKNRHCEMFFCTSLLKATRNAYGYAAPERKTANAHMSSILFVDLDLPEDLASLSDEEVTDRLFEEFGEMFSFTGGKAVRSGNGIHLYFGISSFFFENGEQEQRWRDLMRNLNILFISWGSDLKCNDKVRLLRLPGGMNRKKKYGPIGKEVKVLYDNFKVNDFSFLEQVVDYELTRGELLKNVLDDIIPVDSGETVESGFVWLGDIDLGIFNDEQKVYSPNETIRSEVRKLECEQKERKNNAEEVEQKVIKITRDEYRKKGYYESYIGIRCAYDDIMCEKDYRIRDICFFLNNRSSTEGVRHITIWYLTYSYYNFLMIRDYEVLKEKMSEINKSFFKPMMNNYEFEYCLRDCFNTIEKTKFRDKNIRNQVIEETYMPTLEEKKLVRGNYFPKDSEEFKDKEKKEHARRTREYRERKRQSF